MVAAGSNYGVQANRPRVVGNVPVRRRSPREHWGGSATAGGMNFQYVVTAIAATHLARGSALGWLSGIVDDTPVAVWAETGGSGDDIRVDLRNGEIVEVQAKKGLKAGDALWASLMVLSRAIARDEISYGVLVVAPDSSRSIANDLSRDLRRMSDGRFDGLKALAKDFRTRLDLARLSVTDVCQRLRIVVVHGLDADAASVTTAKTELAYLCSGQSQVSAAWNCIYRHAGAIVERRGRWQASDIAHLLQADGVSLADAESPACLSVRLAHWVYTSSGTFSIIGIRRPLSITQSWLPLQAVVEDKAEPLADADIGAALTRYHAGDEHTRYRHDSKTVDAEWLGRFYRFAVVQAGPGMGKSTLLTRLAQAYANDGYCVLKVKLKLVAARMADGDAFFDSVLHLGLDGSGLAVGTAAGAAFQDWVLLCDGLDECHDQQQVVAEGLKRFAIGYPRARVVVTTRPVGYVTSELAEWRHYRLLPLEPSDGPRHLRSLLHAVLKPEDKRHAHAMELALEQMQQCQARDVVARSPQLLGMATSLLVRGGALGTSRVELYRNLFALIDDAPNPRAATERASAPVRIRVLNLLGWELMSNPLETMQIVVRGCASRLAPEIGEAPLRAQDIVSVCVQHWQDVGVLEQMHHGAVTLLTFTHKAFAEFAAARCLGEIASAEDQRCVVGGLLDGSAWQEVLDFAAGLGLAEHIVTPMLGSPSAASIGRLSSALRRIELGGVAVSASLRHEAIARALAMIDTCQDDEVFELGSALADMARVFPDEVGLSMDSRWCAPEHSTRLIAWACMVASGSAHCDPDAVFGVLEAFRAHFSPAFGVSLYGDIVVKNRSDKGRRLLHRLALDLAREAIDSWTPEDATAFLNRPLMTDEFCTAGFYLEIKRLVEVSGKPIRLPPSPGGAAALSGSDTRDFLAAACAADRAVLDGLLQVGRVTEPVRGDTTSGVHLSAFVEVLGRNNAAVSDVWNWIESYDPSVVSEVLLALLAISATDPGAVFNDAVTTQRLLEGAAEEARWHVFPSMRLDVPAPEWHRIRSIRVDRYKLELALSHGSHWLVVTATNLLWGLGQTPSERLVELLAQCEGDGLAGAAYLVRELAPSEAAELLLARFDGPVVHGMEHLYSALRELGLPWNEALSRATQAGLMSSDQTVAEAAAQLALHHVDLGAPVPLAMLKEAFVYWTANEISMPRQRGVISPGPRDPLFKALLRTDQVEVVGLLSIADDSRSHLRELASDACREKLRGSAEARSSFVSAALDGTVPARAVKRMLREKIAFAPSEIDRLRCLLHADDAQWRFAACELLDPCYLATDQMRAVAQALLDDPVRDIRESVYRALAQADERLA